MNQFDKVIGVFNPTVTHDLKERVKRHIGNKYEFEAIFIIEEGKYTGQYAMYSEDIGLWIPEEDIEI